MKKLIPTVILLFISTLIFAQEKSTFQISTTEIDLANTGRFYYNLVCRKLDRLIINKALKVYSNETLSESMSNDYFLNVTRLSFNQQVINPSNPDDIFDLIDTVIQTSMPIGNAQSILWLPLSIKFKTETINGEQTFYLSRKEVEKFVESNENWYILIVYYSDIIGELNPSVLFNESKKVLAQLSAKLFDTNGLTLYSNYGLSKKMEPDALKKSVEFLRGGESVQYNYFPATPDSLVGFIFGYTSQKVGDAFELEVFSIGPTYISGEIRFANPWYWASSDEIKKRYTDKEWSILMAVQYYKFRKTISPYFEYYDSPDH